MPLHLPPGSSLFPHELQRKVQEFNKAYYFRVCAGFGCRNDVCENWVLAESMSDGSEKPRAHSSTNHAPESIIPLLEQRLGSRAPDIADEIEKHNTTREAELAESSAQGIEQAAEALYDVMRRS